MIYFLLTSASFLNFSFYIFAIGFVVSLILEQFVKNGGNERDLFIVQTNRKYCWRQAWIVNILWILCNIFLYFMTRNITPMSTNMIWNGGLQ